MEVEGLVEAVQLNKQMKTVLFLLLILVPTYVHGLTPQEVILQDINTYRKENKLAIIKTGPTLCKLAQERAVDIVTVWSHKGFGKRMSTTNLGGYFYENLAKDFEPEEVVQAWKESPTHNENLLREIDYGCVGVKGKHYTFEGYQKSRTY